MIKKYPRNEFEDWLVRRGFHNGNPVSTYTADQEREHLANEFFVRVTEYERIIGDETVLVFAPRGGGKSALRVRLATMAEQSQMIAIEITDFGWLVKQYQAQNEIVTIADHQKVLLRQAAIAIFNYLFLVSSNSQPYPTKQQRNWDKILLGAPEFSDFIYQYAPDFLQARHLHRHLRHWFPDTALTRQDIRKALVDKDFQTLFQKHDLLSTIQCQLLIKMCDETVQETIHQQASLAERFQELIDLLPLLDIQMIHFLIDRLDEIPLMSNNFEAQANLLQPLLEYLHLLEMPSIGFKFFLAQELKDIFYDRSAIRRDRLLDKAIHITWNDEKLREVIERRLSFYSDGQVPAFQQLCNEDDGDEIEKDLLTMAQGSPRRALHAVHVLFETSYYKQSSGSLIDRTTWLKAKQKLLAIVPPLITVSLSENGIYTAASGFVNLTRTEKKIIQAIITRNGVCDRDVLKQEVWNNIGEDAVDQAIRRLRKKLGEIDGQKAIYLENIRGYGFKLNHYEVKE